MTNVTLPDKTDRGIAQGWLQSDKKVHQLLWRFGIKNPSALALLHFFTSRMNRGTNAVILSSMAVSQATGLSQTTVKAAVKALSEAQLIQILKSGKSNVYVINSRVAWQGHRGLRHAAFNAEIVVVEAEQSTPVDELIEDSKKLVKVPVMDFGERMLVGNEDIDPPDQGELELP